MNSEIVGTWVLVRGEVSNDAGESLSGPYGGEKAMGLVRFNADGRMMAVLCDGRPSLPVGATREYNSYCGNYTFDGKQLTTTVDASAPSIPVGSAQVRDVTLEGNRLVLRPPARAVGNRLEQRALYWEKIADI